MAQCPNCKGKKVAYRKVEGVRKKGKCRFCKGKGTIRRKSCKYCGRKIFPSSITIHERYCKLNPEYLEANTRICVVCEESFLSGNEERVTCSRGCANTHYRSGSNHANYKEGKVRYREIAFKYHKHRCVICGEKNSVDVHHYDENKKNNSPRNLVPLCPTHHKYMHTIQFKPLIIEKVKRYMTRFKKKYKGVKMR